MKRRIVVVCLILALTVFFSSNGLGFRNIKEGDPIIDFSLKDLAGRTHSTARLKGKTILIIYWRVGQDRSHQALKELKLLSEKISDQPLQILAITKDVDKLSEIKSLKKSLELPFPVLLDSDAEVYSGFGIFVFPSTALVDGKGIHRFHYGGFRPDYQEEIFGQVRLQLGLITEEKLKAEKEKKFPTLTKDQKKAINHINLGRILRNRGLDEKAVLEAQKAVDLDQNNWEGRTLLGFCLLDQNEVDQALQHFQKAVYLNSRSSDAKIGLGTAYRMKGETQKALEILQSGLDLCPNSAVILLELGEIYESLGKTQEALKYYKSSAECSVKMHKSNF